MELRKLVLRTGLLSLGLTAALVLSACGGGNDDDSDSGDDGQDSVVSGATGSDEKFVGDICKAAKAFADDLDAVAKDPNALSDPSKIGEKIGEPFSDFADSFAKAKPPSDLKQWHTDASKELKATAAKIKKGEDLDTIFAGDANPFPDPPEGPAERISKVAESNDDCKEASIDFGA